MRRLRSMAVVAGLLGLAAVPGLLAAACGEATTPTPTTSATTDVVVSVDGEPITQADVDAIRAELRLAGADDSQEAARAQAMRRLLVRREAQRRGVTVEDEDVAARVEEVRASAGGEEALASALKLAGMTLADLESAARYALLERELQDALFPDRKPTAAAVREFYRENRGALFTKPAEVKLRRLTVPNEKLAREAAAEVADGSSFASVARHYSMDSSTRFEGGLLGWISATSLPSEVADALADLGSGDVSQPVFSFGRWHLYNVVGRRPAEVVPFAEIRGEVIAELTRRLRAEALNGWVRDELQQAAVESGS